jgi:hypothetical protein
LEKLIGRMANKIKMTKSEKKRYRLIAIIILILFFMFCIWFVANSMICSTESFTSQYEEGGKQPLDVLTPGVTPIGKNVINKPEKSYCIHLFNNT